MVKCKIFSLLLLFSSLLPSSFAETPFDWSKNLTPSTRIAQVEITGSKGENTTARVLLSFSKDIRNGQKITFVNHDPAAVLTEGDSYFLFLRKGEGKNRYVLPAAACLAVSQAAVRYTFYPGESPYEHPVKELSDFLGAYADPKSRKAYCEKLFQTIRRDAGGKGFDPLDKEAIRQYFILDLEGAGDLKQFLRDDFLLFIQNSGREEASSLLLSRGIEYMGIMQDLGIWNLESYFYDFMGRFNGLDFRFRENPALFILKKNKEDSLRALLHNAKPPFLPEGKWDISIRLEDDLSGGDYRVAFYCDDPREITETLIAQLSEYTGAAFGFAASVLPPSEYPLFVSGTCAGNRLLGHFIRYLIPHVTPRDVTFLLNLQRYGYARTPEDAVCLEQQIQAAEEKEGKISTRSKR